MIHDRELQILQGNNNNNSNSSKSNSSSSSNNSSVDQSIRTVRDEVQDLGTRFLYIISNLDSWTQLQYENNNNNNNYDNDYDNVDS